MRLAIRNLGTVGYLEARSLQLDLVEKRRNESIPDTLLLLEHPPVVTLGRRAGEADLLADEAAFAREGVEVVRTDRGGQATYHGPGQLVGYLIFNLYQHGRRLKRFVHQMEEVFIRVLGEIGIEAGRDEEHRGVWVGNKKITAIGIAVKDSITYHGFAFNLDPTLRHFDLIVPCGITDRGQTSVAELLKAEGIPYPGPEVFYKRVVCVLAEVFGYEEITGSTEVSDYGEITGEVSSG